MGTGAITSHIDVAQVALYSFWVFFAGLIYYLRREDKREGYPLVSDRSDQIRSRDFRPRRRRKPSIAERLHGDRAARGAAHSPLQRDACRALARRADASGRQSRCCPAPDPPRRRYGRIRRTAHSMTKHGWCRCGSRRIIFSTRKVPTRSRWKSLAPTASVGGVVSDLWIDRGEVVIRYLEVTLAAGAAVLVPMPLAQVDARRRRVVVRSVLGAQFAYAPMLANPDQVTLREEDQIAAYFASGNLYAEPRRVEPLL